MPPKKKQSASPSVEKKKKPAIDAAGGTENDKAPVKKKKKSATKKAKTTKKTSTDAPPKSPSRPTNESTSEPKPKLPNRSDDGSSSPSSPTPSKKKAPGRTKSSGPPKPGTSPKMNVRSKSPVKTINGAGNVDILTRKSMMAQPKAASMIQVKSPKNPSIKNPPARRPQPQRTRSDDRDLLRLGSAPMSLSSSDTRKVPNRSHSGDLEHMVGSTVKDQRTDVPVRSALIHDSSHRGILKSSTRHGDDRAPPLMRQGTTRARFKEQTEKNHDAYHSDLDDDSFIETEPIKFKDEEDDERGLASESRQPRPSRPGFYSRPGLVTKAPVTKSKSLVDLSNHNFKSSLDLMNISGGELWPNDPIWKKTLRYIRILPPHPQERPERRKIRIYIWVALVLDFVAAVVSLTTYSGVSMCCEKDMFSLLFVNGDWKKAIQIITYIYMVLIFAEIIPVVRRGLPFNLLNPIIGFLITFAVFFNDRITEAICMWIIGATSVFLELFVYRLEYKLYHGRYDKLDEVQKNLKSTRLLRTTSHRILKSTTSSSKGSIPDLSDDDSVSGNSFGEDDDPEYANYAETGKGPNHFDRSATLISIESNHKYREARLLRERRQLRLKQKEDSTKLNYHLAGVVINLFLLGVVFILTVVIASSGGLCIRSDQRPMIFRMNQLGICDRCQGNITDGSCQICDVPKLGDYQCYYQY